VRQIFSEQRVSSDNLFFFLNRPDSSTILLFCRLKAGLTGAGGFVKLEEITAFVPNELMVFDSTVVLQSPFLVLLCLFPEVAVSSWDTLSLHTSLADNSV